MAAPSTAAVRAGLISVIGSINLANGFQTALDPSHIYPVYNQEMSNNTQDKLYPKVFIVLDTGKTERLPSYQSDKSVGFIIVVVLKANESTGFVIGSTTLGLQDAMSNFIDDIELALSKNTTLSGVVDTAQVDSWTTDSGFTYPESVALIRVKTERKVTLF